MIDGIHVRVHGKSLLNIMCSDKLDFRNVGNKNESKYKGLIITVFTSSLTCLIRGSIHKFYNDGLHNADLFTLQDFQAALEQLEIELCIYPDDLQLLRIEIGMNVPINYSTRSFIEMIALINGKKPTRIKYGVELKFNQYSIKVYAKSLQYKNFTQDNIIRIEVAYARMIKFRHDIGHAVTLKDLLNKHLWNKMIEVLEFVISRISIFDYSDLDKESMSNKEQLIFFEWSNPIRLAQEPGRIKRYRFRKKVMELYEQYSENIRFNDFNNSAKRILDEIASNIKDTAMPNCNILQL